MHQTASQVKSRKLKMNIVPVMMPMTVASHAFGDSCMMMKMMLLPLVMMMMMMSAHVCCPLLSLI